MNFGAIQIVLRDISARNHEYAGCRWSISTTNEDGIRIVCTRNQTRHGLSRLSRLSLGEGTPNELLPFVIRAMAEAFEAAGGVPASEHTQRRWTSTPTAWARVLDGDL